MFKRILQLSFGFVIAIAMSGALNVHAADTDTRTATTQASISLKAGGNITLDSAPDFDFPSTTIDADHETNPKLSYSDNQSDVLQVTNPGLSDGWSVTLQVGRFETANGSRYLKGASLDLSSNDKFAGAGVLKGTTNYDAGVATTSNNTTDTKSEPVDYDTTTGKYSFPANTQPLVQSYNLPAEGDPIDMFMAFPGQGVGIWQTAFDATLHIPAGNVEGSYKADLTWTLTNAPTI